MSENINGQTRPIESRELTQKGSISLRALEKPKSPEAKERDKAQRALKAAREKVQRVLEPKRLEFGRSRPKRKEGLEKEIKNKGLRKLLISAAKAIGKDETSSEHELFQGLQIKPKDLKDPELTWVIAKTAELEGITRQPEALLKTALEATHRGGNSPLAKEFRQRLCNELVKLGEYEVYRETVKEILQNIEAYHEISIGWYGAPDEEGKYDGDLRRKDIEMLAEETTEESLRKVLRVKEETEVEEKTAIQTRAMEAKKNLEGLSPELENILERLEHGELVDKPEDLIRAAIQLRKFPQFAEDVRLGNVVSAISRLLVKLIEKEKKDKNFLARIQKAVQALYSKGTGLISDGEWERFQLFFDKFPERLPDLLEVGGASGVTAPPTTEETFYNKLISLSIDPAQRIDPHDPVYQKLQEIASSFDFYEDEARQGRRVDPGQIEEIVQEVSKVYARATTNDALRVWLDNFTRALNERHSRIQTIQKEEQRAKRQERMFPHLSLIQDEREKLDFAPADVSAVENVEVREYLDNKMANIQTAINNYLDDRKTPPPPSEVRMYKRQVEDAIKRYLENPDLTLTNAERNRIEGIRNNLIDQLARIERTSKGILEQIPIRERWMALGLEPDELNAIKNPETAEQWFRDRLILIEEREEKQSSVQVLRGGPYQKLNWGLEYLYSLKDNVWQEEENQRLRKELEQMVRLRIHLHDHFHGYAREEFKEIQGTISELGIGGVVQAESLHGAKTMIAKDTLARMFERFRFVKVKLGEDDTEFTGFGEKGTDYIAALRMTPPEQRKVMQATIAYLEEHRNEYGFRDTKEIEEMVRVARNIWVAEQRYARHRSRDRIDRPSEVSKMQGESTFVSDLGKFHLEQLNFHDFVVEKWHILTTSFAARYRRQLRSLGRQASLFYEQHRGGKGKLTDKDYLNIGKDVARNLTLMYTYWDSGWRIGKLCDSIKARYSEIASNVGDSTIEERVRKILEDYENEIAVGARLRKTASDYQDEVDEFLMLEAAKGKRHMEKVYEEKHKGISFKKLYSKAYRKVMVEAEGTARAEFLKMIEMGMRARPLEFAKILANDQDFNNFLASSFGDKLSGRLKGINNYIELEQKLGDIVYPIYTKVVRPTGDNETDAPFAKAGKRSLFINSRDLTKAEKKWVIEQLPEGVSAEDFFTVVDGLHKYLTKQEIVREIADNPKYSYFFRETRWIDDIPFHELHETRVDRIIVEQDDPSVEIARVDKDDIITFSEETVSGGNRDPLVRVYGDMQAGDKVKAGLSELLQKNNMEDVAKLTAQVVADAKGYTPPWKMIQMGPIVLETFKDLKADRFWNVTGLAGKINLKTSRAQREFNSTDPSLSLTSSQLFKAFQQTQHQYGSWTIIAPWFYDFATNELGFHFVGRNLDTIRAVSILLLVGLLQQMREMLEED